MAKVKSSKTSKAKGTPRKGSTSRTGVAAGRGSTPRAGTKKTSKASKAAKAPEKPKAARKPAGPARLTPRELKAARDRHAAILAIELEALKAEARERKAAATTLEERFQRGLERCRTHLSSTGEARLRTVDVSAELARQGRQSAGGTPWAIVGRVVPPKPGLAYSDLYHAMLDIRDDGRISSAFHPQRLSRIVLVYFDTLVGKPREWTLSEIGPWEVVASRAVAKLDPSGPRDQSVTVRYDEEADVPTMVLEVRIWLSMITFKERRYGPK